MTSLGNKNEYKKRFVNRSIQYQQKSRAVKKRVKNYNIKLPTIFILNSIQRKLNNAGKAKMILLEHKDKYQKTYQGCNFNNASKVVNNNDTTEA